MGRRRYKCLLSREEILKLREEGKTFKEIGSLAGVSKNSIRSYINPEPGRKYSREFHRKLKGEKRGKFLTNQNNRRKESQKLSLELKPKQALGGIDWTTTELEYLAANIKTKTILQLAKDLKRTFHSTKYAVQTYTRLKTVSAPLTS